MCVPVSVSVFVFVCICFNFLLTGGMPAPSAFPSFYNSGDRRDGFYLLPQVASSQFSTTDNALDFTNFHFRFALIQYLTICFSVSGGSSRGGYRMASSDMRELKAHIMQVSTRTQHPVVYPLTFAPIPPSAAA
jgi:hypothetical protein